MWKLKEALVRAPTLGTDKGAGRPKRPPVSPIWKRRLMVSGGAKKRDTLVGASGVRRRPIKDLGADWFA